MAEGSFSDRYALIGLGNPGKKYSGTRHNVGFWFLESLLNKPDDILSSVPASPWTAKGDILYARCNSCTGSDVFCVKPQTFMNCSGQAVVPLLSFYKIDPSRVIVIHDDLDLSPGVVRLKLGGTAGGHRGVLDLERHLNTSAFLRVRIGIGRPVDGGRTKEDAVTSWVLSVPSDDDQIKIRGAVELAREGVKLLFTSGLEQAQQYCHSRNASAIRG